MAATLETFEPLFRNIEAMKTNGAHPLREPTHNTDSGQPSYGRSFDAEFADEFLRGDLLLHEIDAIESAQISVDLGNGGRQRLCPRYE